MRGPLKSDLRGPFCTDNRYLSPQSQSYDKILEITTIYAIYSSLKKLSACSNPWVFFMLTILNS